MAYLTSAGELGSAKDGRAVVTGIHNRGWFDDRLFGRMRVRVDGTAEHAMYLAEVKKPSESSGDYDFYKILNTIPAEQAFQPESETGCSLTRN
jgi:branched-chain amino acid transport system substrate-binding protein